MKQHNQSGGDYIGIDKIVLETAILTRATTMVPIINNIAGWEEGAQYLKICRGYSKLMETNELLLPANFQNQLKHYHSTFENIMHLHGRNLNESIINMSLQIIKSVPNNIPMINEQINNILTILEGFHTFYESVYSLIFDGTLDSKIFDEKITLPPIKEIQQLEHNVNVFFDEFKSIVSIYIDRGYSVQPEQQRSRIVEPLIGGRYKTRKYRKLHK